MRKLTRSNCRKSVWRKRGTPSLKIVFGSSFQNRGSVILEPMSHACLPQRQSRSQSRRVSTSGGERLQLGCVAFILFQILFRSPVAEGVRICTGLFRVSAKIRRTKRQFIVARLQLLSGVQTRMPPKVESDVFELSVGLVIIFSTVTMTLEATHPDFS